MNSRQHDVICSMRHIFIWNRFPARTIACVYVYTIRRKHPKTYINTNPMYKNAKVIVYLWWWIFLWSYSTDEKNKPICFISCMWGKHIQVHKLAGSRPTLVSESDKIRRRFAPSFLFYDFLFFNFLASKKNGSNDMYILSSSFGYNVFVLTFVTFSICLGNKSKVFIFILDMPFHFLLYVWRR